jgi:hypothetical protein
MKIRTILLAGAMAFALPVTANAAVVGIEDLNFDLDQFAGAYVTTTSTFSNGVLFDNAAGVNGYTVGELAGEPGGTFAPNDVGDQLTLGNATIQQFLTLHYAPGVLLGAGQASLFAVYEQASGNGGTDEEGRFYEIAVNGGSWVDARNYPLHQTAISANYQNRVVFDLTASVFGLLIGDALSTVSIRNILGSSSFSDPDIVFMGRAGQLAAVPLPAGVLLLGSGLGALGLIGMRRKRAATAVAAA